VPEQEIAAPCLWNEAEGGGHGIPIPSEALRPEPMREGLIACISTAEPTGPAPNTYRGGQASARLREAVPASAREEWKAVVPIAYIDP